MLFARREAVASLEVAGAEAAGFLNDLVTAQIADLEVGQAQAACLLTPQGRILFDMLVFRVEADKFWIQLFEEELAAFHKRLMMYRLRRPVEISIIAEWQSGILFDADGAQIDRSSISEMLPGVDGQSFSVFLDPRDAALGWHIVSNTSMPQMLDNCKTVSEADWHYVRIKQNVPEGPADLVRNRALMLEAGLEHLGAVDFTKGCYIGQEVTARTHYRGLVKRRIIPILAAADSLSPEIEIHREDVVIGQVLSATRDGILALASLRLDAVKAHLEEAVPLMAGDAEIRVVYPDHLPPLKFPE